MGWRFFLSPLNSFGALDENNWLHMWGLISGVCISVSLVCVLIILFIIDLVLHSVSSSSCSYVSLSCLLVATWPSELHLDLFYSYFWVYLSFSSILLYRLLCCIILICMCALWQANGVIILIWVTYRSLTSIHLFTFPSFKYYCFSHKCYIFSVIK